MAHMHFSFECKGHLEVRISRYTYGGIGREYYIHFQDRKKNSISVQFPDLKDFKKTLENLNHVSTKDHIKERLDWAEFDRKREADLIKKGEQKWDESLLEAEAAVVETKGIDGFITSTESIATAKAICRHFGVRGDKQQFEAVIDIIRDHMPREMV